MAAARAREIGEVVLAGGKEDVFGFDCRADAKLNGEPVGSAMKFLDEGAAMYFAPGGFGFFEKSLVEQSTRQGERVKG